MKSERTYPTAPTIAEIFNAVRYESSFKLNILNAIQRKKEEIIIEIDAGIIPIIAPKTDIIINQSSSYKKIMFSPLAL